jgi:4-amino-4-deoxy-L-arabinose transferase-like glycosyltransferase
VLPLLLLCPVWSHELSEADVVTELICGVLVLLLLWIAWKATRPDPHEIEDRRRGKHSRPEE